MQAYALRLVEPGINLFRFAMGQGIERFSVDEGVEPGTYRIASGLRDTVLQVSDHDSTKVVAYILAEKQDSQQVTHSR
jgi:hypothetical protein